MALTLEQINKNKSQKKNTLSLNSTETHRPFDVKKGELVKPDPSEKLEKKVEQLQKIETKTQRILERVEKKKLGINSPQTINKVSISNTQTPHKAKREASYFTYICLPPRKLPRKVLDHVKNNAFIENGEWYSKIDSFKLSEESGINSHQVSNTVRQLKLEGFFEILDYSTSGYRLLKINPEIYGLNKKA